MINVFCPNCGKQIPKRANVCPYCGYQLKKAGSPSKPNYGGPKVSRRPVQPMRPNNKKHRNKKSIIIGVVCLVILLLFGLHIKNQYITPNVEMSKTATDQSWTAKIHDLGEDSTDTMIFHSNGRFTDRPNNGSDSETGSYKFGKNIMTLSESDDNTDGVSNMQMKCTKYSHGKYTYKFNKYNGKQVPAKSRNRLYVTFQKK